MDDMSKDIGKGSTQQTSGPPARGISRRTAIKAAVAAGAAVYAIPAVDTLTGSAIAHAASVSPGTMGGPYLQTCGGNATYPSAAGSSAGSATLTITPCQSANGVTGNRVTINDPGFNNGGGFNESGVGPDTTQPSNASTVSEIEFDASDPNRLCVITITNVVNSCSDTPSSAQMVTITCTNINSGATDYQRTAVMLSSGKVAKATCP